MENESNETGVVVRVAPATWKSQGKPLNLTGEKEPIGSSRGLRWTNPAGSERLVRRLLEIVNTQEEYELLVQDLEELQALGPLCSNVLKGGAARSAGTR